jgi:hypothetical protein
MNATTVTLEEVIAAADARAASLVPETSGYLALAIGDATARLPLRLDPKHITVSAEGTVTVARSRDVVAPVEAASTLRALLASLLTRSVGTMPGLRTAARARAESERGVESVVEEIEAALIPVNRAAARRALARLARETARARDGGALRVVPLDLAAPPALAPSSVPPRVEIAVDAQTSPSARDLHDDPDESIQVFLGGEDTPAPAALESAGLAEQPPDAGPLTPTDASALPPCTSDDEPPLLDEAMTTLDVETACLSEPASAPLSAPDAIAATPASAGACFERHTLPLGSLDVAPRPVAQERGASPPAPPAVHVETVPMRFEIGRVVLGVAASATLGEAPAQALGEAPAQALGEAPAQALGAGLPASAQESDAAPTALVISSVDLTPESETVPRSPAFAAPETPTMPIQRQAQRRPWAPPPAGPKDAELGPVAESDVDALIATFSRSAVAEGEPFDALRASLKQMAELTPTRLPPAVRRADRLAAELRRREPTPPPPRVETEPPRPSEALPEPRRASRARRPHLLARPAHPRARGDRRDLGLFPRVIRGLELRARAEVGLSFAGYGRSPMAFRMSATSSA